MSDLTTQDCEREFRADEKAEAREERRFDEEVRYAPRGLDEMPDPKQVLGALCAEFFEAALDLSNAIGLLASGELNVAKDTDRWALHQAFGNTENALEKAKKQFHRVCVKARLAEDDERYQNEHRTPAKHDREPGPFFPTVR